MSSEVADATGNVKYNRSSLWTTPSSVLVTGVLLKACQRVLIFSVTGRTSGSVVFAASCTRYSWCPSQPQSISVPKQELCSPSKCSLSPLNFRLGRTQPPLSLPLRRLWRWPAPLFFCSCEPAPLLLLGLGTLFAYAKA